MTGVEAARLEQRFASKTAAGLLDVRFDLRVACGATAENVCKEVNALYDAVERGDCEPLNFEDAVTGR